MIVCLTVTSGGHIESNPLFFLSPPNFDRCRSISTPMASTSSSTSADTPSKSHDVFLSFCGTDTRNGFADHLYHKLLESGIRTFRDNEGIHKGEELEPEIETAIKQSRASIVVLSTNYAASTWCLNELLLILHQRNQCNHFVLPVFYGVEPTDVRNQRGSFAIQVKACSKWTDDKVWQWKMALKSVASLSGYVVTGSETSFLKEIVDTIYNEFDLKEVHLPLNLIGMSTHNEDIKSWFDKWDVPFFVIIGMGGSGKTTLAKYMYSSHKRSFEYVSFIGDIGSKCERGNNGILEVQRQLLNDIGRGKKRKIPCVSRGMTMIEDALRFKRALVVLDDIVGETQFVDLLGSGRINAESKIIITTTENPDNWLYFPHSRCQKYEMRLLNDEESSELLCRHAFRSEIPKDGFHKVVLQAIQYCEGNPLALEVLGSSLFKNDTIKYWEGQLSLFGKDINARIKDVLIRSYESLPSDILKDLFLHIACFFNGIDKDYVEKILEPYSAEIGIKILVNRCLVSVSPNKKLLMHRLVQEMGKHVVRHESPLVAERSRVWLSSDSYKILRQGKGSERIEGLALDMRLLKEENIAIKSPELKTKALENMDSLKLLQLNFVELNGSYENFSEDLRWLCWCGFHLTTIPSDLFMGNLVAIDMSYSKLEVFEPPEVLHSLQILNLKDSHNLVEIHNIFNIPRLETLILWNCFSLVHVCKTIGSLTCLVTLNMTGCKNLFNREQITHLAAASTSGGVFTQPTISIPCSLRRLFLKDCHLDCSDSFPLSFSVQSYLQYLNLGNSQFESLPCFVHLEHLRVLDLSFCSRLKCLIGLPNTLAELYVYYCESLEKITFRSPRFTLQEIGYEGCINLYEVEGLFKLVPIAKLDETDLGHMKWLKVYEKYKMPLVGDELTVGRSCEIQMLYEFGIMSTYLPYIIHDPGMTPMYLSKSSSLSFDVPLCPRNKTLKGINVTIKYHYNALLGDNDCGWFCKISTNKGVNLMYNPKVFGKHDIGEYAIWLSYWPIGNKLNTGDKVHVSIVDIRFMITDECGVRLVYSDEETPEKNTGWEEVMGGDLRGFQLRTGAYYLCRRDLFELSGGPANHSLLADLFVSNLNWFTDLVGDTIDNTEIRGWRKTGRPKQLNQSFTELKTVRCIIHGPQLEDFYMSKERSKSYFGGSSSTNTLPFSSSLLPAPKPYITDDDTDDQGPSESYKGKKSPFP